jgi:GTPase SAR1 family protein
MVFFNHATRQMTAKIVYYGPGLCGKTTNLNTIYGKTSKQARGEMVSLNTETDRTLFFDLLPLDVGVIGGMKVRLQLYTVPGQVFYNATRKLVLKGVDGIVFVADSQMAALDANVESFVNLKANLDELGMKLDQVPVVLQYNKRDLRNILTLDQLNGALNPDTLPCFEAAALHGIGVFETLKAISRLALISIRRRLASEESSQRPPVAVAPSAAPPAPRPTLAPPVAVQPPPMAAPPQRRAPQPPPLAPASQRPSAPRPTPPAPQAPPRATRPATPAASPVPPASANPLASLVSGPTGEDVPVEFAEEDTDHQSVRPVQTKERLDIQDELLKLRSLTNTPIPGRTLLPPKEDKSKDGREVERRLQDVLGTVGDHPVRMEVKRKASVAVPVDLLRNSSIVKIRLAFDGDEQWTQDAVTVRLTGNRKLERLQLQLDLELKGKSSS